MSMMRDDFEQLMSEWLDDSSNPVLTAQIEAAVRAHPELVVIRAEWLRVNECVRDALQPRSGVNFERYIEHLREAIDRDAESGLDRLLAAGSVVDTQVDWHRFTQRVRSALDSAGTATPRGPRVIRFAFGLGGLAAAAAIALLFAGPWLRNPPSGPSVSVSSASVTVTHLEESGATYAATVSVSPIADDAELGEERVLVSVTREDEPAAPRMAAAPELFLSISDARRPMDSGASGIY
jgi:hypothetical protein